MILSLSITWQQRGGKTPFKEEVISREGANHKNMEDGVNIIIFVF